MPEHHHHHHYYYKGRKRRRDRDGYAYHAGEPGPGPNPHRLRRSYNDRIIWGVCGGIAEYFGWDPLPVRALWVAFAIVAPPPALISYVVLRVIMGRGCRVASPIYQSAEEQQFWRSVSTKPKATFSQIKHRFRALDARIADMEQAIVSEEWSLRKAFRDLERGKA